MNKRVTPIFRDNKHKKNYFKKMRRISLIKEREERMKIAAKINKDEMISNLKRMRAKGLIDDFEYDKRLEAYR